MILQCLDYADVIFSKANVNVLDKLQRLQNRCLKIFAGFNMGYDMNQLHKTLKVPYLKDRRRAHVLNFMYNQKSNTELLKNRQICTRAHDAPLFNIHVTRCKAFKQNVGYFGSVEWNELDSTNFFYHTPNISKDHITII